MALEVVKVIEVFKVPPAPSTSPAATISGDYLPLTFFDAIWLRFPPTQRVFFYEIKDLSLSVFSDAILPKLKHALSLTLQYYPPLAGNLTWHPLTGKLAIRFATDDDGIYLTVAESTADFYSLATDDVKEAKDLHSLLSDFDVSENQATVVSLQVTLFPGSGFSIGYTAHHAALDGKSAAMFIKSWAKICHVGSLPPELMPVLERSFINDPLSICTIFTDKWKKMPPEGTFRLMEMKPEPGLLRGTFRLTRQQIGQIKSKIGGHVSSFTAVCSYIWTCLVKAEGGDITNENVQLGINMDCRARLEPPIPANYIGNCVVLRAAKTKVVSLEGGDGLVTAAAAIKEAVGSLPQGVLKGAENWLSEAASTFAGQKTYGIGGSPWFELYGADFGWGRPVKVEMVSIDKAGAFSLCEARDDQGGIEIGIVFNKHKIEAFKSIFREGLQDMIININ
ncbi:malonyl-CoA:anthocyanidin 5-O-glucoside-6''-O-malonyltransferase-like [Impatiens glandulifera]|uniref:malonyl-CoA:anthocyanidin 5-O-glucoside-6''-O-malonyltransferase-like n=1 Tax=Impatiens glandulifera TaxID=253017 RepID=UPI001FB0DAF9|nr:malonyl-CoA:anthocyanidin 5-O-glucoside-6''-O-malonyltransferase-like [Impatiens glandulifera]